MHPPVVYQPDPPGRLSSPAMRAFDKAGKADWSHGLSLTDTLVRVNKVAARLFPDGDGRDSRVSRVFTPRSFRHYQTLGCIDAPERAGKQVVYGFRYFVQALLVRRLLWERMASDRIVAIMVGRSTAEIHTFEFRVRLGGGCVYSSNQSSWTTLGEIEEELQIPHTS